MDRSNNSLIHPPPNRRRQDSTLASGALSDVRLRGGCRTPLDASEQGAYIPSPPLPSEWLNAPFLSNLAQEQSSLLNELKAEAKAEIAVAIRRIPVAAVGARQWRAVTEQLPPR